VTKVSERSRSAIAALQISLDGYMAGRRGRAFRPDVTELRSVKEQPGGSLYVIGGAALISSLINEHLIDELWLIVHPIILAGGKSPFAGVKDTQTLELV